jgi:hypothetical protein
VNSTIARRSLAPARVREAMTPGRALLGLVLLAGLVFYFVNVAAFAHQPLRIEENEWPRMAEAIYETGQPLITAEESQRLRLDPKVQPGEPLRWAQDPIYGAWHPPLYQYLLAATMPIFGSDATYTLRSVGVLGLLVSCLLLFLIAREVDPRRWALIGTAGSVLLLLHPYAIQSSLFLDIDTSIYPALLLLLAWLLVRYLPRPGMLGPKPLLLIAGAVALIGWAKLTTIIPVGLTFVAVWILARGIRRGVPEMIAVVAGGAGLFFSTYALWAWATDIPFAFTFEFTFGKTESKLNVTPEARKEVFRWQVAWMHPALMLLAVVYAADALWSFARTRRARALDLLFAGGVAVLVTYAYFLPNASIYQGKYEMPAVPLLILPIAWMCLRGVSARPPVVALATGAAVAVIAAIVVPDFLTENRFLSPPTEFRVAVVLGIALALLAGWRFVPRVPALAAGPVLVAAALFAAQSVHSAGTDTSPLYPFKDTQDFNRAVTAVNAALAGPDDIAIVAKDIGPYVRRDRQFIEGHDTIYRGDALTARLIRENPNVKAWASNSFGPPIGPEMSIALAQCMGNQQTFGTAYVLTRLKPRCG